MIKYKICVFLLFLFSLTSIGYVSAKKNPIDLLGKVIYIDAGHGGLDPGAMYKNIKEKDINLSLSLKLEDVLSHYGAIVYQTRYGDYDLSVTNTINRKRSDLSRRSNIINKSQCDLFVSIHLNAENSETWSGPQVFYDDINSENEEIAKIIQEELNKELKSHREYKITNDMYLQKRIERPGVLIEVGFLSNPNDRYLLQKDEYQDKVVNTISKAIIKYFNN